jgi:hypothetical protein
MVAGQLTLAFQGGFNFGFQSTNKLPAFGLPRGRFSISLLLLDRKATQNHYQVQGQDPSHVLTIRENDR